MTMSSGPRARHKLVPTITDIFTQAKKREARDMGKLDVEIT